ncbi:ABC transporter substrate-binding protein [Pseudoroseicyclus aestuarii]|uniref:NitT/TauT family transport system ATP-binding protein n=1 Tax=Pseudoroseicyclus aestuarii TaxID=1795041 RepID=A0A318SUG7_9RHOB|nr:ABC transporter substrate-binding protein [Pseudoroseicyclus aestuarii]PYE84019.1 NitT/TauT family transport system ATP-binding protein [Pseudoroseicyclus aestuarii]
MKARLSVAYVPLVDAAPIIVAKELGFAEEEGLELDLLRAPSWSSVRDWLAFGRVEAAHLLSPIPVAMALGLGGVAARVSAVQVLSVNGNVVGVSQALAARIADAGAPDFGDAAGAGRALAAAAGGRLRVGVPFPFSMHAELLYYWLSASGLPAPEGVEIRTVPPALMAEAIGAGEIDAFCVGEPWGSLAVETGVGRLLLPGSSIWSFAPEKVLALRTDWAEAEPELAGRLMRAIWRAARWLGTGGVATTAAEILAREGYLGLPPELVDRALSGHLVVSPGGGSHAVPGFLEFFAGAATFPWKSQAAWMGHRMAARLGLEREGASTAAKAVFRTDLYRRHLAGAGAQMPGASEKVEGGITAGTMVASDTGQMELFENRFFDGQIFDPSRDN